jgi:hypothetical protein
MAGRIKEECNCPHCVNERKKLKCIPGFPKIVWINGHDVFTKCYFAQDEQDFNVLIDELELIWLRMTA